MLSELLTIAAPVAASAGIGWAWARTGRGYEVGFVASLITAVGAPCLAFHALSGLGDGAAQVLTMAAAALAAIALCALLGGVVLRLARLPVRPLLPSVMFANTGNMGLPLSFLAFGDQGLRLAIGVFVVHSVAMFTVGATLASGQWSGRALARMPLLYAVALAALFAALDIAPPAWLLATTRLLGGMTIPLMLITLGVSLGRLGVGSLRIGFIVALLRLALGFGVALGLGRLLDLDAVARGVLLVQLSMPVAVFNYLFAERYQTAASDVASAVVVSTLLAFASVPALLWFAKVGIG
jgi:hypothetical protein